MKERLKSSAGTKIALGREIHTAKSPFLYLRQRPDRWHPSVHNKLETFPPQPTLTPSEKIPENHIKRKFMRMVKVKNTRPSGGW